MAQARYQHRADSYDADQIAATLLQESPAWDCAHWQDVREACDVATGSEYPGTELDRLTRMVLRRLGGLVS